MISQQHLPPGVIVFRIVLTSMLICFTQCTPLSTGSNSAPSLDQIKEQFDQTFGGVATKNENPHAPSLSQVDVYVDGSGSMRGFIKGKSQAEVNYLLGQTAYCASLRNLRAVLSSRGTPARFHKFGPDRLGQAEEIQEPTQATNSESFYSYDETLLGPLIQRFSDRRAELPKAFIVVTDGVQSTPQGSDFTAVIDGAAKWLNEGLSFEILAFQSEFNGEAYSEVLKVSGHKDKIGEYSGSRPFYWYVFSIDPGFGSDLSDRLREAYGIESKYLNFSSGPFEESVMNLRYAGAFGPVHESSNRDAIFLHWRNSNLPTGLVTASVQLKIRKDFREFPMDMKNIGLKIEGFDWDTKKPIAPEISFTGTQVLTDSPELRAYDFAFSCVKATHSTHTVSRVFLFTKDTTFSPPGWVKDSSTDNDTTLNNYSKTLFFNEFVNSIILKSKLKDQPLAVFYISVEG